MFGSFQPFGSFRPFGSFFGEYAPATFAPVPAVADPFLAVLIASAPESGGEAEPDPLAAVLIL